MLLRRPQRRLSQKALEKKGTTKDTKSTKKSFSFPWWPSCSSWFEAFMLFATPSKEAVAKALKRREPRRTRRARRRAFLFLSGLRVLRGSRLLGFLQHPQRRLSQKVESLCCHCVQEESVVVSHLLTPQPPGAGDWYRFWQCQTHPQWMILYP